MEQEMKHMKDRAKQAGSSITEAFQETASSAEHMTKRAGEAVESATDRIREHLSTENTAGEAVEAVARKVKQTAGYLQEQGIGGVVEDLEILIRRYPLQTLLLGLGCGYLLSRARTD